MSLQMHLTEYVPVRIRDCLWLCGKKQNLNVVPAALCVGFKAPDYHKTAKSAFWMSLEYAEYVEPASPESASGYEDKRLQCNPQKGQPQHSLTPGVPTSPPPHPLPF